MIRRFSKSKADPEKAVMFEDIIDGYFPLCESLRQMLVRNDFASASITLTHAPIMDIPGLAPDAPVPLRLRHGTAGLADRLDIVAALRGDDLMLVGHGKWRWHGEVGAQHPNLSAQTRLAEPAFVQGFGLASGVLHTDLFDRIKADQRTEFAVFHNS